MAKPTVKVEVAWTDGPYVASPTWSDITSYVRSVSTRRGRTDDWQNFDSGSATIVLDNRDRRFDPTYTAGANYGNLLPRRQIRVTADAGTGGGYVALFRGYVDGWPVKLSQAGFDSTVTISCYEVLGLIAQNTAPYDWADAYIRSLSPYHYYKFDDLVPSPTTTSYFATDYGSCNQSATVIQGTVFQNTEALAPGLPYQALDMATDCVIRATTVPSNVSGFAFAGWSKAVYLQAISQWLCNTALHNFLLPSGARCTALMSYELNAGSYKIILRLYYGGTLYFYSSTVQLNAANPHHFAFSVDTSGATPTTKVVLDGVELTMSVTTAATTYGGDGFQIDGQSAQQYCTFLSNVGVTALQNIYNLSLGRITETTAARFVRAIGQTSVPAALYSATGSPAGTVARINNGGEPINTTIQLAADSEGGELYTTKAGVLTMTNRTWYQSGTSATSQATFGSGGIPIQTEIDYAWNADNIRNALNLTWSGDTTVNASNTTSISTYGTQQDNYETQLSTAADAQTLGNLLVNFGGLPRLVISAVEVGQALSGANWSTVLDLELLDRITVVVPEPVGSNLTQTQIIQQIEHEITPGDWTTRILGSARWSSVFTIGTSILGGTDILG